MARILYADDDTVYGKTMEKILTKKGYTVDIVESAMEGMNLLISQYYDLIISDLVMSRVDGIEFLQHAKRAKPTIKTMILTGNPCMDTELRSLDVCIDRYLSKNIRLDVLLKYIELLLGGADIAGFSSLNRTLYDDKEGVSVNVSGVQVFKNGERISITPKEFGIIVYLLERKGMAISREEILEQIWDVAVEEVDSRVVDAHIKAIRKKLQIQSIIAIRGYGYKWEK